ncbi:hypothetical protein QYE76_066543 [Lolium multiflorum]|uniref:Integrase catalytic domain-containing protein n=1 Tax=Lolium multiflorum TaxID=4521 RepID=A0AAD8WA05_LOLMU|nr:hypothetical protein QYE76_066543 [Lolium multiflorum]
MKPPTTKKELQCLIGKINFVRRFISKLSGRIEPFMGLVKIKSDEEFRWGQNNSERLTRLKRLWKGYFSDVWDQPSQIGSYTRFGIPQTITTDGGSVFVSHEFRKFCEDMGIELIRSSPYYAQANGQDEASNKSLIKLIKRKINEHRRRWHENDLTTEEYAALMSDSIEDVTELRLWSLEKIKENKAKVARAYNKKVIPKEFHVGDLVWEAVLPLGTKDATYGKWSPNWHGPYRVDQVLKGNAYMLEVLNGVKFPVAVNGQHLKKYFPRAVAALVVAVLAAVGAAAGDVFVAAVEAAGRGFVFFIIVVVVVILRPGAEALRRRVLVGGGVLLRFLFLLVGGEVLALESVVVALLLQVPVDEEVEVVLPVGQGLVVLRPDGEVPIPLAHHSGARASYAAIRSYSGAGSLE